MFSRITLLLLSIVVLIDKFVPQVRISVDDPVIYAGLGIYLLLVVTELAMNIKDVRTVKDTTRLSFNYLTKGLIFRKVILFIFLIAVSVISIMSARAGIFRTLVVSVTAIELLVFIVRMTGNYYRVVINGEKLSIIEDQRKVVHHSRIKDVEFRYEVFFFRMKDNNVYEVHLHSLREDQQKRFAHAIIQWLEMYNIPVTEEGMKKLQPFM